MTTAAPSRSNGHDPTRDVLVEAARRMLPVLAGRVLTAATDRAVDGVDQLAGRLGEIADHGLARRDPEDGSVERRPVGGPLAVLVEALRRALDALVRLLAQAAMTVRTATERLRRRRAPEGIDEDDDGYDDDGYDDGDRDGEAARVGA